MSAISGDFAAGQLLGERSNQEDDYGVSEVDAASDDSAGHTLLLVADGMGGHVGGRMASSLAIRSFIERYQTAPGPTAERLRAGLDAANESVRAAIDREPDVTGMGCTLLAVAVTAQGAQWISVGDSVLWLVRRNGAWKRLNADHSMAPVLEELVRAGRMSRSDASTDRQRNALRSAVTGDEIRLVDLALRPIAMARGDRLMLASDGLLSLPEIEIARIVGSGDDGVERSVEELLASVEAAARAGQDNATVLLFEADRPLGGGGDPQPASEETTRRRIRPDATVTEAAPDVPEKASRRTSWWRVGVLAGLLIVVAGVTLFAQRGCRMDVRAEPASVAAGASAPVARRPPAPIGARAFRRGR